MFRTVLSLSLLACFVTILPAATVDYVRVKVGTHKMAKGPSGQLVPLNGPVIHVYSKDGKKYDFADDFQKLHFTLQVKGACKVARKLRAASLRVGTYRKGLKVNRKNRTFASSWKTVSLTAPYMKPGGTDPVRLCNDYLDKQAVVKKKSKASLMADGFVIRRDSGYGAQFELTCKGTFTESDSSNVSYPVWISCEPLKQGKKNVPPARAAKSRARAMPLFRRASLATQQTRYGGPCPTWVAFHGAITAGRAGTLRYRFETETETGFRTGWQEVRFDRPGTKKVSWKRLVKTPEPPSGDRLTLKAAGDRIPIFKGWTVLRVSEPPAGGGKVPTFHQSKKATFTVDCNPAPARRTK